MKVEFIKTKETDGDWFKIKVDNATVACIGYGKDRLRTEDEAYKRAYEIYEFCKVNKGTYEVIGSEEV